MNEPRARVLPTLVDTHVHLNLKAFRRDRREVVSRALSRGVNFMINIGFDLETCRASTELAEEFEFIRASVGVHPHDASSFDDEAAAELSRLVQHPGVVAVGETGLDYYRDLSPRDDQRQAFRRHIQLARDSGLPLVVHNRDALDDVINILEEERAGEIGGVMHCFPGDAGYAKRVIDLGFYVGVGGPVTYSGNDRLVDVARSVPLNKLLLETDAPWLTPEPDRGRRNEPSHVRTIAERVAEIRGMSIEDLARATTGNSFRLFGFPEAGRPSIAYEMWDNLYLNITNRCTNRCSFCVRNETDVLWGYNLRLETEPSADEIMEAVGDPGRYREIVFCGYGEPTLRLDVVKDVAGRLKRTGARVRLDTNGQGNLIWNRNIAPELAEVLDAVSVSLNAQDAATYDRVCGSRFGEAAYGAVLAFIRECKRSGLAVVASVVDVPDVDVPAAARVADELGVALRVRGGSGGGGHPGGG